MASAADDPLYVEEDIPICDSAIRSERVRTVVGRTFPVPGGPAHPGFRSYRLEYSAAGQRMRQEFLDRSGRIVGEWRYVKGRPLEALAYDAQGEPERRCEFVYGTGGLWQEKHIWAGSGALMYRIVADRDATGTLRVARYLRPGEEANAMRSDRYHYDEQGRLAEIDLGPLGGSTFEYGPDHGLLARRCRNLPGASVYGDVLELGYDARQAPVRVDHVHQSVTVLEYVSAPAGVA